MKANIGRNIKNFREHMRLSAGDLANKIGNGWYGDKILNIESQAEVNFNDLNQISKALNVSAETLLNYNKGLQPKYYYLAAIIIPLSIYIFVLISAFNINSSLVLKEGSLKSFADTRVSKYKHINTFTLQQYPSIFKRDFSGSFFNSTFFGIEKFKTHIMSITNTANTNVVFYDVDTINSKSRAVNFYIPLSEIYKLTDQKATLPFFALHFKHDNEFIPNRLIEISFYILKDKIPFYVPYLSLLTSMALVILGISKPLRRREYIHSTKLNTFSMKLIYMIPLCLNIVLMICNM